MSSIVSRLHTYIKFRNLSIRKFEMAVGMSNGALSKAIKNGTDIQTKYLDSIFSEFPELNPGWLASGQGEMIINSSQVQEPAVNYLNTGQSQKKLLQVLASPSQTEEEQILKEEVLRLHQSLDELRAVSDKNILKALKDILKKQEDQ